MFQMIPSLSMHQFVSHMPAVFLITLIKWSALFGLVAILVFLFKKLTPGNRHVLWLLLIYGLTLVPILSVLLPYSLFESSKSLSYRGEMARGFNDLFFLQPLSRTAPSVGAAPASESIRAALLAPARGWDWTPILMLCWSAGVLATSFRLLLGRFRLSALHEDADDAVMRECREKKDLLSKKMGLKKEVHLVVSSAYAAIFPEITR